MFYSGEKATKSISLYMYEREQLSSSGISGNQWENWLCIANQHSTLSYLWLTAIGGMLVSMLYMICSPIEDRPIDIQSRTLTSVAVNIFSYENMVHSKQTAKTSEKWFWRGKFNKGEKMLTKAKQAQKRCIAQKELWKTFPSSWRPGIITFCEIQK